MGGRFVAHQNPVSFPLLWREDYGSPHGTGQAEGQGPIKNRVSIVRSE